MNALITLRVPATSANLGSGFDTIGMAVSLYNIFKVTELLPEGEYKVEALGEGARELSSPKANLVVKAYEETCERWNVKGPGFALWCHNIIPLCRGLGSSAGAVVAGVLIAKYLTGYDADDDELLRAMTMIEGHPDNVAPASSAAWSSAAGTEKSCATSTFRPLLPRCSASSPFPTSA